MRGRHIVDAEGVPAPRDGTTFNAKYSDGVIKVRWSKERKNWEGARANGRWVLLDYDRSPPETWWPEAKAHA